MLRFVMAGNVQHVPTIGVHASSAGGAITMLQGENLVPRGFWPLKQYIIHISGRSFFSQPAIYRLTAGKSQRSPRMTEHSGYGIDPDGHGQRASDQVTGIDR